MLQPLKPQLTLAALLVGLCACSDDGGDATPVEDTGADTATDAGTDAPDAAPDVTLGVCEAAPGACGAPSGQAPTRLSEHGAAYDDVGKRMVVFGGTTGVPENCDPAVESQYLGETWIYDDVCDDWQLHQGAGPSARGRHGMAAGGGAVWMFGGRWRNDGARSGEYTLFNELWRFDLGTDTWSLVEPSGAAPLPRANPVVVWDSNADRLLVFSGNASSSGLNTTPLDDVWAYDPGANAWQRLDDVAGPEARLGATGAFDASRNQLVIFGGFDSFDFGGGVAYFRDIWAFDVDTAEWVQLQNEVGAPEGRFGATMIHDTVADVYVFYGGHDDQQLGNRNDVWFFDPTGAVWARLAEGDTFSEPQIGACNFPPNFTAIDPNLPERRSYGTFVWSETCGHGLLFGGKTDCGSANDVWAYADEAFTEEYAATAGEVCVRFRDNPDNCANLCF